MEPRGGRVVSGGVRPPLLAPLLLLSCAVPATVATAPDPPTDPAPQRLAPVETVLDDPCAGRTGLSLHEMPTELDLACEDGHRSCRVEVPLTVRNCTEVTIELERIEAWRGTRDNGMWIVEPADRELPPGAGWTHRLHQMRAGSLTLQAVATVDGRPLVSDEHVLGLANPARDAAIEACEACHGDWGSHGMAGIEGCNCGTSDGGTSCDDGLDCEGECLSVEGGFACSRFRATFGCHGYLPDGWSSKPHPPPTRIPHRCVD